MKILVHFSIDKRNQKRTLHILDTVKRFVIVININKCRYLLLIQIFLLAMLQFGLIKQIQCRQEFIGILHVNFLALLHDIIKINTIQGNPENALLFSIVIFCASSCF